ncbi:FxsA family protein [Stigmatella aurantiaca]|uniref:FxsA cytoplasmic membrane protein n=1 Tax=Stigmatella aurantiaca (strain DW4/3-1) TaxID=378806 RepID=Q09BQ6_STIAD|nr:FxsA family protein [Stigmatella aurantiaca]ADO73985.1 FxsA cytoplasmic membrane protein [Stigmatella aurantiaca DW4/3-1]EAU69192.1 FxsA protein [Stigmatella aurantiaca DW4/3-1]
MAKYLLLAFIVVPFLDLYLLVGIGRHLGVLPTLALVVGMGLVGASLARREGLRVVRRWQEAMAQGRPPEEGILSGALVLLGGLLLVLPGVITDAVGLILLIPAVRRGIAARLRRSLERGMRNGSVRVTTVGWGGGQGPGTSPREAPPASRLPGEVDAEFTEEKPQG